MKNLNIKSRRRIALLAFTLFFLSAVSTAVQAQTNAFTYQGRFTDTSVPQPTNGTYNMQFALFGSLSGTDQIGTTITNPSVQVAGGLFTVNLSFTSANAFNGTARYLEISIFNQTANAYIKLDPRQQIMSSPYSIRTINANFSDALSTACVACVDNAKIASVAGSKVTGTVANATNAGTATTAGNVAGIVAVANGGTGSSTQNFVDTTTAQTVAGNKTFTGLTNLSGGTRFQNSATDPETASASNAGRVYFNTAINNLRLSDGTRWITAGQPTIYHVYATAGRSSVSTPSLILQPGLAQTITVPAGFTANVVINASIGTNNSLATANLYSNVDFTIFVDGTLLPKGAFNRFTTINTASGVGTLNTSAINTAVTLGAGNHTIDVRTGRSGGTVAVNIGGNATNDVNAGELTLTVYYTPITFANRSENPDTPTNSISDPNPNNKRGVISSEKN